MKFEELGCEKVDIDKECFVYFLLREGEVVYVGQTTNGTARIRQHTDKVFDEAYVMRCRRRDLDELEDKYIIKYDPAYNKKLNGVAHVSVPLMKQQIRKEMRKRFANCCPTSGIVNKAIRSLGIETTTYNGALYITPDYYQDVFDYVLAEVTSRHGISDFHASL